MFQGSCKDLPTPGPPLVLQDGGLVETPRDEAAKEKRTTFMLQKYEVVAILLKATRIVRVVQAITDNTTVALVQSDQKNIKKKEHFPDLRHLGDAPQRRSGRPWRRITSGVYRT